MKIADLFARLSLRPDKGSFSAAERAIGAMKVALIGLVSIRTVQWMGGLVQDTVSVASAAVETAAKLGITAEAVQELGYAASQSGSDTDGVSTALGKLAMLGRQAAAGSAEASKKLKSWGVNAQALADGSLPLDKALEQVADRFASMPKDGRQIGIAGKVFKDLIPLLNEGSAGIKEMRERSKALGNINNKSAAELEGFGDKIDDVKKAFAGVRDSLVIALLPALKKLQERFLTWVTENRVVIVQRLGTAVRTAADAATLLWRGFTLLVTIGQTLVRHWQASLVVVSSLGTALLILRAKSIGAAFSSGAAWAMSMLPIVALAAAIAAAIFIVQDLWVGLSGGKSVIFELYTYIEDLLGKKLESLLDRARSKVEDFLSIGGYTLDTKLITDSARTVAGAIPMVGNPLKLGSSALDYGSAIYDGAKSTANSLSGAMPSWAGMIGRTPQGMAVSSGATISNNITINAPPGADANLFATLLRGAMDDVSRKIANGGG